MSTAAEFQPFVSHLVTTLHGPSVTVSRADGQIDGTGAQGFYLGDRRLLSELTVAVFGREPEILRADHHPDGSFTVRSIARDGLEPTPDPTLIVVRTRRQGATGFVDDLRLDNVGLVPRRVAVTVITAADFADTMTVKLGRPTTPLEAVTTSTTSIDFRHGGASVTITPAGASEVALDGTSIIWTPLIAPRQATTLRLVVDGTNPAAGFGAPRAAPQQRATLTSSDPDLSALFDWGLGDVNRLTLIDPMAPTDRFVAAGSPWYLTLFGRDSLWSARMAIPFDVDLAAGTLRALARRQGHIVDVDSAEQPGRILHEQRAAAHDFGDATLPARYFGSIDATPLWIATLVDAWKWGLPAGEVAELAGALQAAAAWLTDWADANDDGLVEYIDASGHGLANQGWKDSGDSINWRDGELATAPIALCEVQGYAFEAAVGAADLLDHLGLPGAARCREWADRLRRAFHDRFWLEDRDGPFIAIALDAAGDAVDSVSSNAGHLLGTGLLDAAQERLVVGRLINDLACPAGLRTLATSSARFNPVSYHNGSIWPHDVGICARAMVLAGFPGEAATILRGVVATSRQFGGRLPELYGYSAESGALPYPAACRPQAWSAATSLVAAWACTPLVPGPHGPVLLAPAPLAAEVDVDGMVVHGVRWRTRLRDGVATMEQQHDARV